MPLQCLTCTMSRKPIQHHGTSRLHKKFHYVKWLPNNLPGGTAVSQAFRLNWNWRCDGVHPQCMKRMNNSFFHCLDCGDNGFDLVSQGLPFLSPSKLTALARQCACCADRGGIFHHRRNNGHRFAFVAQVKPPGTIAPADSNEPPPPYREDRFTHK